jgi:aspartyl-tRNA(Asn)/glutamyl-tRNA(Gln) amidotransferase subunit A
MAQLRLVGKQLSLVRALTGNPLTLNLLWKAVSKDFKVAELQALSADSRQPLADHAGPKRATAPRSWGHRGLPVPSMSGMSRLREAFGSGADTPVDALERVLLRAAGSNFGNATHSPFVAVDPKPARAAALASAARWKKGETIGRLDGIPVPVKDELHMVGLPTRGGTTYLDAPAATDAHLVRQLRAAGAIVFGKTHATEWGLNACGVSEHFDVPRNVWRNDRGAGGSSTGSAVAVALGFCPAAIGSDGGGSIRIPSSLNGILGIKPTFIRIGRTGNPWGSGTMAHLGPIGRSTEDLVDLLEAATGPDPDDPTTLYTPADATGPAEWRNALGRGVKGCRIGVLRAEWQDASPGIARSTEQALVALERDGAVLVDVHIPLAAHAPAVGALTICCETLANLSDDLHASGHRMGDELRMVLTLMTLITARDLLLAARTRAALRRQAAAVLKDVHLLAMPTTARTAPPYALSESRKGILDTASAAAMTRFAFFANLTGLPTGTIPVGFDDGLPVGLQLTGDAWDEASVFAVMAHAERLGIADLPKPPGFEELV